MGHRHPPGHYSRPLLYQIAAALFRLPIVKNHAFRYNDKEGCFSLALSYKRSERASNIGGMKRWDRSG